jgi:microcystin-dependent protein
MPYTPVNFVDGVTPLNKATFDQLQNGIISAQTAGSIPGELKMWPGSTLPAAATYGKWVWADGTAYDTATYPLASGNIDPAWKTFAGATDPGAGKFRVPDLRGVLAAGMDAMPGGTRANRITRAVAITIAAKTGEEYHTITVPELPVHAHGINDPTHAHGISDPGHIHGYNAPGPGGSQFGSGSGPLVGSQFVGTDSRGTGIGVAAAGTGISIQNTGGGGSHENLPPTVFVPWIVRLDG